MCFSLAWIVWDRLFEVLRRVLHVSHHMATTQGSGLEVMVQVAPVQALQQSITKLGVLRFSVYHTSVLGHV